MAEDKTQHTLDTLERRGGNVHDALQKLIQVTKSKTTYALTPDMKAEMIAGLSPAITEFMNAFGGTASIPGKVDGGQVLGQDNATAPRIFPAAVVLSDQEMKFDGKVNPDNVRAAILKLSHGQDVEGTLQLLRKALADAEGSNVPLLTREQQVIQNRHNDLDSQTPVEDLPEGVLTASTGQPANPEAPKQPQVQDFKQPTLPGQEAPVQPEDADNTEKAAEFRVAAQTGDVPPTERQAPPFPENDPPAN